MSAQERKPVLNSEVFSPDGGLHSLGWYLNWNPGDDHATLDGAFTADELRAIADHMDKVNRERK